MATILDNKETSPIYEDEIRPGEEIGSILQLTEIKDLKTDPEEEFSDEAHGLRVTVWNPVHSKVPCFACRQKGSTICH